MGRRNMGKRKNNSNADGGDISVKQSNQRWDVLPETNEAFVEYYKNQQKICQDEAEWNQLFSAFRTDLPTTFRVTGGKKNTIQLTKIIEDTYVPFLSNIKINNELIPPPQKISWYPNGFAWEFRAPKQLIRKSPELKKFQNFLVYETEAGNLSRQEAVSMIPPLLLDVQSHHYVLDACAAPGSKTAQLVEALHFSDPGLIPKGLVVANDSDYKRSHLLVHQSLRRLPSPCTMITNHDASRFPTLSMKSKKLFFDRILCDVPCSGDGTLRKNGGIWRDWNPANGIGLHGLQLRILSRAIGLLKPGGRIVYSTCSLNPLENEAVVSAALSQFPSMSLKDVSDCLPTLIRRPGLTSWTVTTRDPNNIQPVASPDDLPALPPSKRYASTLWPSGKEDAHNLQRCLRIYPHLQDTGGFFVAVLEKSADTGETYSRKTSNEAAIKADVESTTTDQSPVNRSLSQATDEQTPSHATAPVDSSTFTAPEAVDSKTFKRASSSEESGLLADQPDSKKAKVTPITDEKKPVIENKPQVACPQEAASKPDLESNTVDQPPLNGLLSQGLNGVNSSEGPSLLANQPNTKEAKATSIIAGDTPAIENSPQIACPDVQTIPTQNLQVKPNQINEPLDNPFKEEPHVYLKSDDENIKKCVDFYAIDPSFPLDNLLVRNAEGIATRTIYLTSSAVREVIENNSHGRLRLICSGVKLFGRQDPSASAAREMKSEDPSKVCKWRIVSDGIEYFRPFMGPRRLIQCRLNVLKQLMADEEQYPLIQDLKDAEFRKQIEGVEGGSCVAEIIADDANASEDKHAAPLDLMVGLWISKSSINLMIDKRERKVLSLRLWGEDVTLNSTSENKSRPSNLEPKQAEQDLSATQEIETKVEAEEKPC